MAPYLPFRRNSGIVHDGLMHRSCIELPSFDVDWRGYHCCAESVRPSLHFGVRMLAVKHSFQLALREVVLWLAVALQDQLLRFAAGAAAAFSAEDDITDHHFAVRMMYSWESLKVSCGSGIDLGVTLFTKYRYAAIVSVDLMLSVTCCPVLLPLVGDDRLDHTQV